MYSETRNETWDKDQTFHELKQSDTYGIEITREEMDDLGTNNPYGESKLVKKFIRANARKDAIKQLELTLSTIGNTNTDEARRIAMIKNVYEHLDDEDFARYIYDENNIEKIKMYIAMINSEINGEISARQQMLMYLAVMGNALEDTSPETMERLDRIEEMISGMPDRTYINTVMNLMDSSCSVVNALCKLLNDHGAEMIKKSKEKRL